MDPDGVIEVGAFVSLIINADITFSYLGAYLIVVVHVLIPDQLEYSGGEF